MKFFVKTVLQAAVLMAIVLPASALSLNAEINFSETEYSSKSNISAEIEEKIMEKTEHVDRSKEESKLKDRINREIEEKEHEIMQKRNNQAKDSIEGSKGILHAILTVFG